MISRANGHILLDLHSTFRARLSLFLLYSHPISTASEEILFCMNRHYEMLIPSWYLEISFLQIQIGFEIDGLMWAYPCGYTLFEFEQESISWKILAFVLWLGSSKIILMTYVEWLAFHTRNGFTLGSLKLRWIYYFLGFAWLSLAESTEMRNTSI